MIQKTSEKNLLPSQVALRNKVAKRNQFLRGKMPEKAADTSVKLSAIRRRLQSKTGSGNP